MLEVLLKVNYKTIRRIIIHNTGNHFGGLCNDGGCTWKAHLYNIYEPRGKRLGKPIGAIEHVREDGAESLVAKALMKINGYDHKTRQEEISEE